MRKTWLAIPAAMVLAVAAGGWALAAGSLTDVTFAGCLAGGKLTNVQAARTPSCAASATPVQWAGKAALPPSPSPTATSPSPSPSPTDTSPSPAPTSTGVACTATLGHNCGPYSYAGIPMSNGYDTYVANQDVGAGSGTTQTVTATDPGNWSVTANDTPYGYTGVQTFPDVQQLTNDWDGTGWGGTSDTPLSALSALAVTYSETGPSDANSIYEFAPDIWTAGYPSDVMFWADTHGRCDTGAYGGTILGTAVFGGQTWTVNRYGDAGAEIIFVLDSDPAVADSCAQQHSGTVDIKAGFGWLVAHGIMTSPVFTQLNSGWEITSADNTTFTVTGYSVTAVPA